MLLLSSLPSESPPGGRGARGAWSQGRGGEAEERGEEVPRRKEEEEEGGGGGGGGGTSAAASAVARWRTSFDILTVN